jgi:hypothetical protein
MAPADYQWHTVPARRVIAPKLSSSRPERARGPATTAFDIPDLPTAPQGANDAEVDERREDAFSLSRTAQEIMQDARAANPRRRGRRPHKDKDSSEQVKRVSVPADLAEAVDRLEEQDATLASAIAGLAASYSSMVPRLRTLEDTIRMALLCAERPAVPSQIDQDLVVVSHFNRYMALPGRFLPASAREACVLTVQAALTDHEGRAYLVDTVNSVLGSYVAAASGKAPKADPPSLAARVLALIAVQQQPTLAGEAVFKHSARFLPVLPGALPRVAARGDAGSAIIARFLWALLLCRDHALDVVELLTASLESLVDVDFAAPVEASRLGAIAMTSDALAFVLHAVSGPEFSQPAAHAADLAARALSSVQAAAQVPETAEPSATLCRHIPAVLRYAMRVLPPADALYHLTHGTGAVDAQAPTAHPAQVFLAVSAVMHSKPGAQHAIQGWLEPLADPQVSPAFLAGLAMIMKGVAENFRHQQAAQQRAIRKSTAGFSLKALRRLASATRIGMRGASPDDQAARRVLLSYLQAAQIAIHGYEAVWKTTSSKVAAAFAVSLAAAMTGLVLSSALDKV